MYVLCFCMKCETFFFDVMSHNRTEFPCLVLWHRTFDFLFHCADPKPNGIAYTLVSHCCFLDCGVTFLALGTQMTTLGWHSARVQALLHHLSSLLWDCCLCKTLDSLLLCFNLLLCYRSRRPWLAPFEKSDFRTTIVWKPLAEFHDSERCRWLPDECLFLLFMYSSWTLLVALSWICFIIVSFSAAFAAGCGMPLQTSRCNYSYYLQIRPECETEPCHFLVRATARAFFMKYSISNHVCIPSSYVCTFTLLGLVSASWADRGPGNFCFQGSIPLLLDFTSSGGNTISRLRWAKCKIWNSNNDLQEMRRPWILHGRGQWTCWWEYLIWLWHPRSNLYRIPQEGHEAQSRHIAWQLRAAHGTGVNILSPMRTNIRDEFGMLIWQEIPTLDSTRIVTLPGLTSYSATDQLIDILEGILYGSCLLKYT